MHTILDGNDCQSANQAVGLPCSGAFSAASIHFTDDHFGARMLMDVTGTYDAGWLKVSISGFATWDSAMPGVLNPVAASIVPVGPARIVYESGWNYGGVVMLTVPFSSSR